MIIVKDDNPDFGYHISPPVVKDAEGNVLPDAQVDVQISSDNPDVISLTPTDRLNGGGHVGNPGQANVVLNILVNGEIKKTSGEQFTVTTGDPASIEGADLTFDGLPPSV